MRRSPRDPLLTPAERGQQAAVQFTTVYLCHVNGTVVRLSQAELRAGRVKVVFVQDLVNTRLRGDGYDPRQGLEVLTDKHTVRWQRMLAGSDEYSLLTVCSNGP